MLKSQPMEIPNFFRPNLSFSPLNKGKYFNCLTLNEQVIKFSEPIPSDQAAGFLHSQVNNYRLLKRYLGKYLSDTQFIIGPTDNPNYCQIAIFQNLSRGTSFQETISNSVQFQPSQFTPVTDFFEKSLHLYHTTGFVPDLFRDFAPKWLTKLMRRLSKVDYTLDPNLLISRNCQDQLTPTLVDIHISRVSRRPLIGPAISAFVAYKISQAIRKINSI